MKQSDIKITIKDRGGWYSYKLTWKGDIVWTGDATRHGDCLAAAQRNRKWIAEAIAKGDKRFVKAGVEV